MAGLSDILRKSVAIANRVTASLQMQIQHAAIKRASTFGDPLLNGAGEQDWEYPEPLTAIVEEKQELKRRVDGTDKLSRFKITLLAPIAIDPLDRFLFADGTSFPPILTLRSALDDKGQPYMWEIWT